jgi:hypothetical protein
MFTAARPGWFVAITTDNFAAHFYRPFISRILGTLIDQTPSATIGSAANKQSQP